ncbi:MAG: hypothetical protein KBE16_03275 [Alphaproteobacteria bacterium]|jgi:KDO2-lipid IV(A) lauroyltransferase|nr:hypothetical protein [Alphaproteobacteria bacterium]MBP9877072.1 hypothetical protein [Alphaproteobacteria bacterium]
MKKLYSFLKFIQHAIELVLFVVIYFFFKLLPFDTASALGGFLFKTIAPHLKMNKRVRQHLKIAFPEKDAAWRTETLIAFWEQLGRNFGEFPHLPSLKDPKKFRERVEFKGVDILKEKLNEDRPIICFSGHMANWEVPTYLSYCFGFKTSVIYKELENKYLDVFLKWGRSHGDYITLLPKGNLSSKGIITAMQEKRILMLLVDQNAKKGIETTFFDQIVMSPVAPAKFSLKYDANLFIARLIRKKGAYFCLEFKPLIVDLSQCKSHLEKERHITNLINRQFEEWIRENPAQWLWTYRRWGSYLLESVQDDLTD